MVAMYLVLLSLCLGTQSTPSIDDNMRCEDETALTDQSAAVNQSDYSCPQNNMSAALSFVKPTHLQTLSIYPQKHHFTYAYRLVTLSCCATGYSSINWYKDGVKLSPTNSWTHCYANQRTRQWIAWYSLEPDPSLEASSLLNTVFKCEAISVDGTTSIENDIRVSAIVQPVDPKNQPVFTNAEAEESCVEEGATITITCALEYDSDEHSKVWRINLLDQNFTLIRLGVGATSFNFTRLDKEVWIQAKLHNSSRDMLNRNYYCQSNRYQTVVSRAVYIAGGPCHKAAAINGTFTENIEESDVSVAVAVPLATLLVLTVLVTILLVSFNTYVNMWYRVNVVQRLHSTILHSQAMSKYAAYVVYSDISHPAVATLISTIEDRFLLKLCLPDRDFEIGSITPNMMSECLKLSEKIIIFVSNDMFQVDSTGNNWADTSMSLSLALSKPTIIILLDDIDQSVIKKRKDLSAALKIMKTLKYNSPDYNQKLADMLLSTFKFEI